MRKTSTKAYKVLSFVIVAVIIALFSISFLKVNLFHPNLSYAAVPTDWNQVGKDPQHTSFSAETLGTNFQVKFTFPFQPEKVHPQVQAIVYNDGAGSKVFIGTEMGNFYAIDAVNPDPAKPGVGKVVWKYNVGSPILNSAAADNGRVFFASLDGAVYALNTADGSLVWKKQVSRKGFSAAPILAENKIMIGSRDGIFYGFDFDGNKLWEYNASAPILQTAAWNNGKAYFGTLDMYVHAVNTSDGTRAWKSSQLSGGGFVEYWPVVHQGKIIIRSMAREAWREDRSFPGMSFPFVAAWGSTDPLWSWLNDNSSNLLSGNDDQIADFMNAQNTAISNYQSNPDNYVKNLYILDEATGQESVVAPHWANDTMNGTTTPPCVDRDNDLITPVLFIRSGWGRLDLQYGGTGTTPRIVDILYDGLDYNNQSVLQTNQSPKGMGNPDENMALSCSQNLVFTTHIQEQNAHYTGAFNLDNRKWSPMAPGQTNKEMWSNTQGGGANPTVISNGLLYHISGYELIVRTTN